MKIKTTAFFLIFFLIIPFLAFSQEEALNKIIQDDLKRHLEFIASDSLQGRSFETNFPGLDVTAAYLKKVTEGIGLKPALPGFSQKVEIIHKQLDLDNIYIQISNNKGKKIYRSGELISLSSQLSSSVFSGEMVFAGFGLNDLVSGHNDFEGIDIKDRIVFIAEGTPETFLNPENPVNRKMEDTKKAKAFEAGAKAVVTVSISKNRGNSSLSSLLRISEQGSYELFEPETENKTGIFLTTSEVADKILGGRGKYAKYISGIAKSGKPESFIIEGKQTELSFRLNERIIQSENIIGIVEGSDLQLKNEYVVYMAHFDHLGVAEDGDVYNGADDNGSGVVTLISLAKAFLALEVKPKRSIVFLWVTAEEPGLFGSDFYSRNPVFPMNKTVTCINLDMVGRVYEPRDSVWNHSPKLVKDFDGIFTLSNDAWPGLKQIVDSNSTKLGLVPDYSLPSNFLRSSDHYHFHKNGVPILSVATGYHADYHKPSDEISKIDFNKMKRVADLVFLIGYEVANSENFIRVNR